VELFGKMMDTVTDSLVNAMRVIYTKYRGLDTPDKLLDQEIQKYYRATIEQKKEVMFRANGITEQVFDMALRRHQTNPRLTEPIKLMQIKQKQTIQIARRRIRVEVGLPPV